MSLVPRCGEGCRERRDAAPGLSHALTHTSSQHRAAPLLPRRWDGTSLVGALVGMRQPWLKAMGLVQPEPGTVPVMPWYPMCSMCPLSPPPQALLPALRLPPCLL